MNPLITFCDSRVEKKKANGKKNKGKYKPEDEKEWLVDTIHKVIRYKGAPEVKERMKQDR